MTTATTLLLSGSAEAAQITWIATGLLHQANTPGGVGLAGATVEDAFELQITLDSSAPAIVFPVPVLDRAEYVNAVVGFAVSIAGGPLVPLLVPSRQSVSNDFEISAGLFSDTLSASGAAGSLVSLFGITDQGASPPSLLDTIAFPLTPPTVTASLASRFWGISGGTQGSVAGTINAVRLQQTAAAIPELSAALLLGLGGTLLAQRRRS